MTTSATYGFNPNLASFIDEAVELAGLEPQSINGDHILSIRRSMGFAFSKWASKGHREWKFEQSIHTVTQGEFQFNLPKGTVDLQTVIIRRQDRDTGMIPASRSDYTLLADKTIEGRPDRYFIDRRRDDEDTVSNVRLFYWPRAENNTDQIIVDLWRQVQDPGTMQSTFDMPFRFLDALVFEVAWRTALKFKPDRAANLETQADKAWGVAHDEDRDPAPFVMSVSYSRRHGRRR
jgi:hypothetical protein